MKPKGTTVPRRKIPNKLPKLWYGCNATDDAFALDPREAQVIRNMHIDENAVAATRHGCRLLNTTALDGAVTAIYDFRRPDGASFTNEWIIKAGQYLYSMNPSTFVVTEIVNMDTENRPTFATFQDADSTSYVFIADGINFYKYDGTTLTDVSTTYPWAYGAPRYLFVYDDRLLAAGLDSDPYRVFVSDALDGTEWFSGEGSTAVYWTLKSPSGDRITGLSQVYNFGVIFQQFGVAIITEADPSSDTSQQIQVSREYGTTSHQSIQSVGNVLYFADRNHIYKGTLRQAIENGLEVTPIDKNVYSKYADIVNAGEVVSVYDSSHKEIWWGFRTGKETRNNIALVYNVGLSGVAGMYGARDVWSGWFDGDGFEPYAVAPAVRTYTAYRGDGVPYTAEDDVILLGRQDGHVTMFGEAGQYKDETYTSETVENDIQSEIHTAVMSPHGAAVTKRARDIVPLVYSRYNDSTTIQFIVDGRKLSTARTLAVKNIVPLWNDGTDTDDKQLWNNTVWTERPMLVKPIAMNVPFQHLQVIIANDGSNAKDEISYSGLELYYQPHGIRRNV